MSANHLVGLSPKAAWDLIQEDPRALLIDIRSSMEFLFVGHPVGAVHIHWIDEPDWDINPHFTADIRKLMLGGVVCDTEEGCAPILLICRSGKRSKEAGEQLLKDGLKRVYHIDEGFEGELNDHHQRSTINGWRFHGLPWSSVNKRSA